MTEIKQANSLSRVAIPADCAKRGLALQAPTAYSGVPAAQTACRGYRRQLVSVDETTECRQGVSALPVAGTFEPK